VIDPGHGGKDPGAWEATSSPVPEKAIVLDVSLKVMELLRQRGATVVPTRTTDSYPSLEERADLAARTKTDLFVSIHADSAPSNPQASGTEVYIYTQASAQSERAAREVVAAFERAGFSSRGIKRRNLHVLREHPRPAILIECGFMTNRGDMRNLNKPAYRTRLAEAIADGIERSLR
jgi:N-acetylmuramoyl-L-alanine amidase